MPRALPNFSGLQRLEQTIKTRLEPLQRSMSFGSNAVTNTQIRKDPGVQARQATTNPGTANAQLTSNYRTKFDKTRDFSSRITQMTQTAAQQRRLQQMQSQLEAAQARTIQPVAARAGAQRGNNQAMPVANNYAGPINSKNPIRQQIVKAALSLQGTPYAWGGGGYGSRGSRGTGLGTQNVIGVDCSGLTQYAYGSVGIKIPRHSNSQTASGYRTNIGNAQPGDLVGWNRGGHVAIYIGNGMIMESRKPGTRASIRRLGANEGVYAVRLRLPGD
ncbi:peptidoglycan endopeptidase [Cellulosimicrobium phage DS1]|nr:peptidoglycan endopeptidase [Cellulosimicrobium phage DS1]